MPTEKKKAPVPDVGRTYIFEAAHEVVAHGGAGQIRCVWTASHVEEIIGSQHGVVLLSVARGGQQPIH